jgi:ACS family glucarate transporter-like MFS transporter
MGLMGSAFYIPYIIMMFPVGYILNRWGSKKLLGGALILWGLATTATAFAYNVATFLATRIAMGIFEAPAYPTAARTVGVWVPNSERALSVGLFNSCARLGTALAPPVVAWLIINYGWQSAFVCTGLLAVIVGIIWFLVYHEPEDHPKVSASELAWIYQDKVLDDSGNVKKTKPVSMFRLLTYTKLFQASFAYACYLYVWQTFATWMPAFFTNARGFTLSEMGVAAMYPYLFGVIGEITGGAIADRLYRGGISQTLLRRAGLAFCLFGSAIFLFITIQVVQPFWIVFFMCCYAGINGLGAGAGVQAIPIDLAPTGQEGGFAAFYAFIGGLGSFFAPMIMGFIIDSRFGYDGGFVVTAIVACVGAFLFIFNKYERLELKKVDLERLGESA